jgi:hypothetical protein
LAAGDTIHPDGGPAPSIADGSRRRLDPAYVEVQRISRWIFAGVVSVAMALQVLFRLFAGHSVIWLGVEWLVVTGLLVFWSHFWPAIAYRHASYVVSPEGIEIRRGVIWRAIVNVPRSRIQHTDVSQGPLERGHHLGSLSIFTAGTDYARVGLPGLRHGTAMAIRDHLLPGGSDDAV